MSEGAGPGKRVAVVVGNPKPRSRTYQAAHLVAERLAGRPADVSVDLIDLGAALLDWSDSGVSDLVAAIAATDLTVFASPTYKATYTGLLKLFIDRIGGRLFLLETEYSGGPALDGWLDRARPQVLAAVAGLANGS